MIAGVVAVFIDGPVSSAAADARGSLGGDVLRELEALQQFGQGASIVVIASAIWLLDPARRRRLLDWLLAIGLVNAVVLPMKMLIGRPRPALGEPGLALGPFGAFPFPDADPAGVYHAWDTAAPISSALWSMPSNHTAHAAAAAAFLWALYPRLLPLCVVLATIVASARVLLGAHFVSDVLVGGAIGVAAGTLCTVNFWGVRLLDAVWIGVIDRKAMPALGGSVRGERGR